ncbi:hypothetical protein SDC9_137972 [bioreactor metagenome]|uniref:Uncharacterized protein n=1 Tax=bioreactor metagenome TaxID=1076179 RepID=A0A645DNJ4_9ZZZZ
MLVGINGQSLFKRKPQLERILLTGSNKHGVSINVVAHLIAFRQHPGFHLECNFDPPAVAQKVQLCFFIYSKPHAGGGYIAAMGFECSLNTLFGITGYFHIHIHFIANASMLGQRRCHHAALHAVFNF